MAHDMGSTAPAQTPAAAPTGPQPRIPVAPAALQHRLPHAPTPDFLLKAHPMRWMCVTGPDGDPEWLPQLSALRLDLGTNGVDKMGSPDHGILDAQKRGWVFIPKALGPGGDYVRQWDCTGGVYHCLVWETPKYVGNRILDSDVDTAGYYAFLRSIVNAGLIKPDPSIVTQVQLEQQIKRIEHVMKDRSVGAAEVLEVERERLAEMEIATEKIGGAPTKRPRGTKGKA